MTSIRTCPRCGAPLAPNQDPNQPCPRCLLQAALRVSSASSNAERVPAPAVSELQQHFPQLEILELIGEGGMGAVYKARDKKLDRLIALKILTIAGEDGSFDERFSREARAMAQLSHPNIAAVHEHGKAGPWSYLFLEYVEGENLRRRMRSGTVTPKEALIWVGQICDALQYAHEHGVVHRDIKPENVLIDAAGRVKVVDFGLAKLLHLKPGEATLTSAQQALGTWHYMAPEQYERPQEVDHRADIYSLGVVFYELLTGQVPIGRFDLPSQRIQIDVRLDDVVLKALAREPDKRYQAAADVKSDVEDVGRAPASSRPQHSHAGTHAGGERRQHWSFWLLLGVAGIVVVCLSLGCLGALFLARAGRAQPEIGAAVSTPWYSAPLFLVWALLLATFWVAALVVGPWIYFRNRRNKNAQSNEPHRKHGPLWILVGVVLLCFFLGCGGLFLYVTPRHSASLNPPPPAPEGK